MTETIVHYATRGANPSPLGIYAVIPPLGFINPAWLAVSHVPEHPDGPEKFILYFLDSEGDMLEMLQYETLEIALHQAYSLSGIAQNAWSECSIPLVDGYDRLPTDLFCI